MARLQLRGGNGDGDDADSALFSRRQKRQRPHERARRMEDLTDIDLLGGDATMLLTEPTEAPVPKTTVELMQAPPSERHKREAATRYARRFAGGSMLLLFATALVMLFVLQTRVWLSAAIIIGFLCAGATIRDTLMHIIKRILLARTYTLVGVLVAIGIVQIVTFADGGVVWRVTTMIGALCGMFAFLMNVSHKRRITTIEVTKTY